MGRQFCMAGGWAHCGQILSKIDLYTLSTGTIEYYYNITCFRDITEIDQPVEQF